MCERLSHREESTLRRGQGDVNKGSNGIGLDNERNRLYMFYDREDVFEISSPGKNKGTCVRIYLFEKTRELDIDAGINPPDVV